MNLDEPDDYEIGYSKPPKKSRFKPGTSGNPEGRPKGGQSFGLYLEKALNKRATISIRGEPTRLTMREIITLRIMNGAMNGDPKDINLLLNLMAQFDDTSFKTDIKITVIDDEDER